MPVRRVVLVCYPGFELLDLTGPASVFGAATALGRRGQGYALELVAPSAGPVPSASGLSMIATGALGRVRGRIDTLLVGGSLQDSLRDSLLLAPQIARLSKRSRRTAAVCTGAFLLGAAGLLRGRRAATHWAACEALQRRNPDCRVERDPIFVRDRRVWTSAGVTAGIDLALALVEEDHGPRLSLEVARWLVMYLRRPGGQSQFSAPLQAQRSSIGVVQRLVGWMSEHLRDDLAVEALAKRSAMSVRNFARVFRRETGAAPGAFVERLRLEAARRSLELDRRSAKEIAAEVGFQNPETMNRAFQRLLGVTPLQYRARFSAAR